MSCFIATDMPIVCPPERANEAGAGSRRAHRLATGLHYRSYAMSHATSSAPPSGHILDQHHREIEEACLALLGPGCAGVPGELTRRWGEIEYQLYDHMMA